MQPASTVLSYIKTFNLPDRISGSHLGALIRIQFPDFQPTDYGCRNLREFIAKFLPGMVLVGRSGMDCLYSRVPLMPIPPHDTASTASSAFPLVGGSSPAAIWKTFASPRTSYRLYGNAKTGELRVLFGGPATLDEPWQLIPSCTAAKHVEIARDFVKSLQDSNHAEQLGACIGPPDWWLEFYKRTTQLGVVEQWSGFRRGRILEELEAALLRAGVPATHLARLSHTPTRPATPRSATPKEIVRDDSADRLRRVATILVGRMSLDELRRLPVHLGDVLDELAR